MDIVNKMTMNIYDSVIPQNPANILIVDDSIDGRLLVEILLQDAGYNVQTAESGQVALQMVESSPPDLIILDLMMPKMSGYEVIKILRCQPTIPFIPVLIMTACGYLEEREQAQIDVDGIIYKPINLDLLLSQVEGLLKKTKKPRNEYCLGSYG
ncbi:response regulator [Limnospira sp. PMC 1298.21]|uniref:response regulator n=4 Tax=Sirenicapillariaceae TaxID=2934961 RepID=UPI0028E0B7F6|nr:response regulator [Limnospira sp. PMC 1261.20]MDT9268761.1 response regulator [Limnospira sp. PMC 1234.20]MDT9289130.1 response regulator [Limnospira sp. PMC 1295.21]MDT9299546.1 response regulator [Limnospira sp. PMC 1281.21]